MFHFYKIMGLLCSFCQTMFYLRQSEWEWVKNSKQKPKNALNEKRYYLLSKDHKNTHFAHTFLG